MKASPLFRPVPVNGKNKSIAALGPDECSKEMYARKDNLPVGSQVFRGIPFDLGSDGSFAMAAAPGAAVSLDTGGVSARWLVFAHTCEPSPMPAGIDILGKSTFGDPDPYREICKYTVKYADGGVETIPVRLRMETGSVIPQWGEDPFLSVIYRGNFAIPTATESTSALNLMPKSNWGTSQTRVKSGVDWVQWRIWLYAWENPRPGVEVTGIEILPTDGTIYLLGLSAGDAGGNPLRHTRRRKTALKLAGEGDPLDFIDIDLGDIISVQPRLIYDNAAWEQTGINTHPVPNGEYLVEYAAHDDAVLYPAAGQPVAVSELDKAETVKVSPAEQKVTLRVVGPDGRSAPARVHSHGAAGEYLPPRHRHRIPNPYWFEDYSADYVNGPHYCCYIDGTAEYLLPQGEVFFEVSKGFEITPRRVRFNITPETDEIIIKLERALDWRSKGWVTADTHVHFLSPHTALLESEAEGVNVVNLLASQWGELFTNMGDFTGRDLVSPDKEYVVRTGTENRQSVLGHISLIGYGAPMILPLTTGGPNEAALGDPVDITLSDWARRSREQGGLAIMPHFPRPVGEGAAAMISNLIDGVEACSGSYNGIGPAFLSHWYRFLNCGYHIPVVGGTDKMGASTAIGTARTYAKIDGVFSYETWKDAVRAGHTFVSYGALCDIEVEGAGPGGKLVVKAGSAAGSSVTVNWRVASATVPVTSVELVVNGETADGLSYDGVLGTYEGSFRVPVAKSGWIALRVRGHMKDKPEIIIAHTSAVMLIVDGQPVFNTPDAVHILEQIEGVTAYIKNIGTKAQEADYKRALLSLSNAYNLLHNKLHIENRMHLHSAPDNHEGH